MLNDKKVALNGKITKYLRWPINLSVLWIVVTAIIFFIDKRAGVVMAFATILFIVIAIVMMLRFYPNIKRYLVGFYFALALFVVENTIHTNDRKTELIYVITDFFENSVNLREQISRRENDYNIEIGSSKNEQESEQNVNVNEINNTNKKIENEKQGRINITKEQERIINEVLGEYLQ